MALQLGTSRIEAHGAIKLPKLQAAMNDVLANLGFERTYEDKQPPEVDPEDGATQFQLLENGDGVLAIEVAEDRIARDLARMMSEQLPIEMTVFVTAGRLFHRRSVEVQCRKFQMQKGQVEELPVMPTHTVEVTDVEHNETRQLEAALLRRIHGANNSFIAAEGTAEFSCKKVLRYRRVEKNFKWSSPRLKRLMDQIETCESFEVVSEGQQAAVRLVLAGGARGMSFLKAEEAEELEKALRERPELDHRRLQANGENSG